MADLTPFLDSLLAMPKFGPVMKSVAVNPEDTKDWERREVMSPVDAIMGVPVTFDAAIPRGMGRVKWSDGTETINPLYEPSVSPTPDSPNEP